VTVIDDFRVDIRPYSGYANPAFPIASYIAQGGSVGDATAGSVFQNLLFRVGEEPFAVQSAQMYNIEQLSIDAATTASPNCLMTTTNMDQLAPTRIASPQKWNLHTVSDQVGESSLELQALSGLPIWLGRENSGGLDAGVRFEWDNIDLRLYAVTMQGYCWGPRSVLAEGGPQRPPFGLFR